MSFTRVSASSDTLSEMRLRRLAEGHGYIFSSNLTSSSGIMIPMILRISA